MIVLLEYLDQVLFIASYSRHHFLGFQLIAWVEDRIFGTAKTLPAGPFALPLDTAITFICIIIDISTLTLGRCAPSGSHALISGKALLPMI